MACFLTLFVKEDLRRINAEKHKKKPKNKDGKIEKLIEEDQSKNFKLNITENTVSDISQ